MPYMCDVSEREFVSCPSKLECLVLDMLPAASRATNKAAAPQSTVGGHTKVQVTAELCFFSMLLIQHISPSIRNSDSITHLTHTGNHTTFLEAVGK